jgi:hypothetical protein
MKPFEWKWLTSEEHLFMETRTEIRLQRAELETRQYELCNSQRPEAGG